MIDTNLELGPCQPSKRHGPIGKGETPVTTMTIAIKPDAKKKLHEWAWRFRMSASELCREILNEALTRYEADETLKDDFPMPEIPAAPSPFEKPEGFE